MVIEAAGNTIRSRLREIVIETNDGVVCGRPNTRAFSAYVSLFRGDVIEEGSRYIVIRKEVCDHGRKMKIIVEEEVSAKRIQ
ncbi:MAG: hypothetical protein GY861_22525 [bacterium]|nr:hypothetical protein [bacterium]